MAIAHSRSYTRAFPSHESSPLEADARRAEGLLHDLAGELRLVPIERGTHQLHVRALGLKRDVSQWRDRGAEEDERRTAIDELLALHDEATQWRQSARQTVRTREELGRARMTWARRVAHG